MFILFGLVVLLMSNWLFIDFLIKFPINFFHLLGSITWSILGIMLLAVISYIFGE